MGEYNIKKVDSMKIVIDIGGSILCPKGVPDVEYLKKLRGVLLGIAKKNRIVIVVGGGGLAKKMITSAEKAGARNRDLLDRLGITATRVNAGVLAAVIGDKACQCIPDSEEKAAKCMKKGIVVVMGGLRTRQTTDAVAVQVAKEAKADLIVVATNVKGVYNRNPFKFSYAKFIESMTPEQLAEIVSPCEFRPGHSGVMDPVAAKLLIKSRIKTVVLDGRDLENLKNALEGKEFTGSIIE